MQKNRTLNLATFSLSLLLLHACNSEKTTTEKVSTDEPTTFDPANPGNPVITHKYTANPAALVHNDTVYLYAGHDQKGDNYYLTFAYQFPGSVQY